MILLLQVPTAAAAPSAPLRVTAAAEDVFYVAASGLLHPTPFDKGQGAG